MILSYTKKFLRWTFLAVGVLVALFIIVLATVMIFEIKINLSSFNPKVESAATEALGRRVNIEGSIELVPTLWPTLEVAGLRIANPEHWDTPDFARVNQARLKISLIPLIFGKIRILELASEGIAVFLERKADGQVNWSFDVEGEPSEEKEEPPGPPDIRRIPNVELLEISIRQATVKYRDGVSDKSYEFEIEELVGNAALDEPLQLTIQGAFQKQEFIVFLRGGNLADLFAQKQPWPLDISAEVVGASLKASVVLGKASLKDKEIDFTFKLSGNRFEELEPLFASLIPQVGSFNLSGRFDVSGLKYKLSELRGSVGETTFTGDFDFCLSQKLPTLSGSLSVQTVDLAPFLATSKEEETSDSKPPRDELDQQSFTLDVLQSLDADVEVTIGKIVNAPADIRNASIILAIHDSTLKAPIEFTINDSIFNGGLELKALDDIANLTFDLKAHEINAGGLARSLTDNGEIEGKIDRIEISASGKGSSLEALINRLNFKFGVYQADLSYRNVSDGEPAKLVIDIAEISLVDGKEIVMITEGTLLNERFKVEFSGGGLNVLRDDESWPINLSASVAGAKLNVVGEIANLNNSRTVNLKLEIKGARIGDLTNWTGVNPSSEASYSVIGNLFLTKNEWRLTSITASIGQTSLSGEIGMRRTDPQPIFIADLDFDTLDVGELGDIFKSDEPKKEQVGKKAFTINMPILPTQLEITDADIDINIKRVVLEPSDITNVSLSSRIRNGKVNESPFQASIGETMFTGYMSLDMTGDVPEIILNLKSNHVNIGTLLDRLEIAEGVEANVEHLTVNLLIKGRSIRRILEQSRFTAEVKNGEWTLRDQNTGGSVEIHIVSSTTRASPDQPILFELKGLIDNIPIEIGMQTLMLADFTDTIDKLPVTIRVEGVAAQIELDGEVTLPVESYISDFKLTFSGELLDGLNELVDVSLPPIGPYSFSGQFSVLESGYYLSDLDVRVGQSSLTGESSLETIGIRPRLDIDLSANTIQINDFDVGDWSPVEKDSQQGANGEEIEPEIQASSAQEEPESILSPSVMRSFDSRISVNIEKVLLGEGRLGSGSLTVTQEAGKFSFDSHVDTPGGPASLTLGLEVNESDVSAEAIAKIERLDYGILARSIDPDADVDGLIDLDLNLKSRAKNSSMLMENASGYINFAVMPGNLKAGIFDLWAANLLFAVFTAVISESKSKVNCLVARFIMKDGLMEEETIVIDTTKVRVSGDGEVNFKTQEVFLRLKPHAKRPRFFSVAIPIIVDGSFSDFSVDVTTVGLLASVIRMGTSVVVVPIQWLIQGELPADGKDVCEAPMKSSGDLNCTKIGH